MQLNYKDIELNFAQRKLLKKLKKHPLEESNIPEKDLAFLKKFKLIKCLNPNDAFHNGTERVYTIADTGILHTRFTPKDRLRTWYPYIASTIAIIISVIALYRSW